MQATRRITGDLLGLAELERTPALVELARLAHGKHVEVESSADGRFVFTDVQPGRYQLTITPLAGAVVFTEAVECPDGQSAVRQTAEPAGGTGTR